MFKNMSSFRKQVRENVEFLKYVRIPYYSIAVLSLMALSSCEDVIDVELKESDSGLYAVEARITSKDQPWVFITKALPVTVDQVYTGISGAIVTVSDDQLPPNVVTLAEDAEEKGRYIVPEGHSYFGVAGRTYTLTIETPDGIILTATDNLHPVEPIDSIQIRPSLRGDLRFLGVFTYGNETPGLGDYYKWDVYVNDTLLNEAFEMAFASDEWVDGLYVENFEVFTDFHDPNEPEERKLKFMDTVYVEQTSISKFAYEYYYQMINQAGTGFLFSVPPANVPSNFTSSDGKDVLGLFTAHDISYSNVVIIDESIENQLRERP